MILDTFTIVANDDREQWEFTPKLEDGPYTSYTVSYKECSNKADACIAVYQAIRAHESRQSQP